MGKENEIAIIGGGILGMTLSLLLTEKGKKVHLYEAAPDIGGLADFWEFRDITWDRFYHVILMSDLNTRELLKKLGIENKMNWVETKTGFYTEGKLYSMSNSVEFLRFPPLRLIDKFRLGITIFVASKIKNWKKLEKQSVAKWLTKWSGKRTFNKMWLPLLRAKLGDFYTETSAAFIWATIQRMYAARKSGLKKEMFGYMEGGYKTILETLKQKLADSGVEIHTGHALENVTKKDGAISLTFKNGTIVNTSDLVFTIPSSLILKVWPDMPKEEVDKHNSIKYLGVSCTSVLLKKPISPYYVTNITDGNVPFTGVIEMSALVDKKNFNGNSLVYLPKYVGADDPIFTRKDDEIHKEFRDTIVEMYDHISEEDILEMKTAKARNVFALSTLNYSTKLPEICSSTKGIYYGNSALITNGTLNVNETIDIAKKIANYIV
jgi:protoporphyrinogen oxidase